VLGLHRLRDDASQLGSERIEIHLVAEPRTEALERARSVERRL
jgi:hypothetical protein